MPADGGRFRLPLPINLDAQFNLGNILVKLKGLDKTMD